MALTEQGGGSGFYMPVAPAYAGGGYGGCSGMGWGGDWGWIILLLLLAGGGWGNGFGGGMGGYGNMMLGYDFLGAAANARALNFASNIAGVTVFAVLGLIDWSYAIPMGLSMIVGAWCGAHMALKKGTG